MRIKYIRDSIASSFIEGTFTNLFSRYRTYIITCSYFFNFILLSKLLFFQNHLLLSHLILSRIYNFIFLQVNIIKLSGPLDFILKCLCKLWLHNSTRWLIGIVIWCPNKLIFEHWALVSNVMILWASHRVVSNISYFLKHFFLRLRIM